MRTCTELWDGGGVAFPVKKEGAQQESRMQKQSQVLLQGKPLLLWKGKAQLNRGKGIVQKWFQEFHCSLGLWGCENAQGNSMLLCILSVHATKYPSLAVH